MTNSTYEDEEKHLKELRQEMYTEMHRIEDVFNERMKKELKEILYKYFGNDLEHCDPEKETVDGIIDEIIQCAEKNKLAFRKF